jgi:hypothetical protein
VVVVALYLFVPIFGGGGRRKKKEKEKFTLRQIVWQIKQLPNCAE